MYKQWSSEITLPTTLGRVRRAERAAALPDYAVLLAHVTLEKKKIRTLSQEEELRVERELQQAQRREEEVRRAAGKCWENYTNVVRNIPGGETAYQWHQGNLTAGIVAFGVDVAGTIGPSRLLGGIPSGGRWSRAARIGGACGSGLFLPGVPSDPYSAAGWAARQAFDAATNYDNPLPNLPRVSAEFTNRIIDQVQEGPTSATLVGDQ